MITYVHIKDGRRKILRPMSKLDDKMLRKRIAVYDDDMEVCAGYYLGTNELKQNGKNYGKFITLGEDLELRGEVEANALNVKHVFGWVELEEGETAEDLILQQFKNGGQNND